MPYAGQAVSGSLPHVSGPTGNRTRISATPGRCLAVGRSALWCCVVCLLPATAFGVSRRRQFDMTFPSGPHGSRTHRTDFARVSRPHRHAGPFLEEVRPGIEPGLRPYHGRVPPKHLQTIGDLVIPAGIEPAVSWMSARRLRRWTTGSWRQ